MICWVTHVEDDGELLGLLRVVIAPNSQILSAHAFKLFLPLLHLFEGVNEDWERVGVLSILLCRLVILVLEKPELFVRAGMIL